MDMYVTVAGRLNPSLFFVRRVAAFANIAVVSVHGAAHYAAFDLRPPFTLMRPAPRQPNAVALMMS